MSAPRLAIALAAASGALALAGAGRAYGASAAAITPAPGTGTSPGPVTGAVIQTVSQSAQRSTRAFWNPALLATATPQRPKASLAGAPSRIPKATNFTGVPTIGTLFYTAGKARHFCTASALGSTVGNLILTAAHCVYASTFATNIEYVPEYHDGHLPYGAWVVRTIVVTAGWQRSHDPGLDFAFLAVVSPAGMTLPIQRVTGALSLAVNAGYAHPIEVIGYNETDSEPVRCATRSLRFEAGQMEFYCHHYGGGTSGGPWILGYNPHTGTGRVFGVIGGYQEGGGYEWSSYSPYFAAPTLILLHQAENALHQARNAQSRSGVPIVWLWSLLPLGVLFLGWVTLALARSRRAGTSLG